jgi:hypothetical protein
MLDGLIYVEQISERTRYFEHTFFAERGLNIQFTNDPAVFRNFSGQKLTYSEEIPRDSAQVYPSSVLFQESLIEYNIKPALWRECAVLSFDGVPDPLATMFYILTRYEEYFPAVRDAHERYQAKNSLQAQHFDLTQQTVERIFHRFLEVCFPTVHADYKKCLKSEYVPTFDIDNTFAFKWKEGWRTWASNLKDLVKNDSDRKALRKKVQTGELKDPFDSWTEVKEVLDRYPQSKVFWLLGDFKKFDKNISWNDPRHQRLIREIDQLAEVGLHPSYASNTEPERLGVEKSRLEVILDKKVVSTRQHFLKLKFPQTYRNLVTNGFKHDYSLGYAEAPGFRSGTAHSHFWFDLEQNVITDLRIHPFTYMEGTLNEYLKWDISKSIREVKSLMDEVKTYGGSFIPLWHNESFAESGIWKGWRKVFDETEAYWLKGDTND